MSKADNNRPSLAETRRCVEIVLRMLHGKLTPAEAVDLILVTPMLPGLGR